MEVDWGSLTFTLIEDDLLDCVPAEALDPLAEQINCNTPTNGDVIVSFCEQMRTYSAPVSTRAWCFYETTEAIGKNVCIESTIERYKTRHAPVSESAETEVRVLLARIDVLYMQKIVPHEALVEHIECIRRKGLDVWKTTCEKAFSNLVRSQSMQY